MIAYGHRTTNNIKESTKRASICTVKNTGNELKAFDINTENKNKTKI